MWKVFCKYLLKRKWNSSNHPFNIWKIRTLSINGLCGIKFKLVTLNTKFKMELRRYFRSFYRIRKLHKLAFVEKLVSLWYITWKYRNYRRKYKINWYWIYCGWCRNLWILRIYKRLLLFKGKFIKLHFPSIIRILFWYV